MKKVAGNSWADQDEAFFGSAGHIADQETDIANQITTERLKQVAAEKFSETVNTFRNAAAGIRQLSISSQVEQWGQYPGQRKHDQPPPCQPAVLPPVGAKSSSRTTQVSSAGGNAGSTAAAPATATLSRQNRRPVPASFLPSVLSNISNHVKNYVPICVVCGAISPSHYQFHPFFPSERACASHTNVGKCNACHRFEPSTSFLHDVSREFADLADNERKICSSCFRSVIVDSADAAPLWSSVVRYLDEQLGLFRDVPQVKSQMEKIPILIVGHDGLNDPSVRGSGHGEGHTRGLCMYEYRYHPLGGNLKDYLNRHKNGRNPALSSVLNVVTKGLSSSNVTAILCIKGLPRDLAGSILAHEATHAWFKLHPNYDPRMQMPSQVEEGCCQLIAYLYLLALERSESEDLPDYGEDGQPSDKKLRQYFRYCIETDTSEVYGEGFRLAAAAHSKLNNVSALFEYVAANHSIPRL